MRSLAVVIVAVLVDQDIAVRSGSTGSTAESDTSNAFATLKSRLGTGVARIAKPNSIKSPYDFGDSWNELGFDARWEQFKNAVPLSELDAAWDISKDTGPRCWPSLEGPGDSEHLAILQHGYLSCPGVWYPQTAALVQAGFRVMRPLLPGHGRMYKQQRTGVCKVVPEAEGHHAECAEHLSLTGCNWTVDWGCPGESHPPGRLGTADKSHEGFDCCCSGIQSCEDEVQAYEDDLSQMPMTPDAYLEFAEAIGRLAEQFKREHPKGKIVALGHSLGGMITAKYALERPLVVDRIMLKNPMFRLAFHWARPLLQIGSNLRVSLTDFADPNCDRDRQKGDGGYCQMFLGNIIAMTELAHTVLCKQWGLSKICRFPGESGSEDKALAAEIQSNFSQVKAFQIISTVDDPAVDASPMQTLFVEVQRRRNHLHGSRLGKIGAGFCNWPPFLGHGYVNNRFNRGRRELVQPYVEHAMVAFLSMGQTVPEVQRWPGQPSMCFEGIRQVAGKFLTVMPSYQPWKRQDSRGYLISHPSGKQTTFARTLFEGRVQKSCSYDGHNAKWRYVEVVDPNVDGMLLLALRRRQDETVTLLFAARNPVKISTECEKKCILPSLVELDRHEPLYPQLDAIQRHEPLQSLVAMSQQKFCKDRLVEEICDVLVCEETKTNIEGVPDSRPQLWNSPRQNITLANRMSCDVTFQNFFMEEVVVPPRSEASKPWAYNMMLFWNRPRATVRWQSCGGDGKATVFAGQTFTLFADRPPKVEQETGTDGQDAPDGRSDDLFNASLVDDIISHAFHEWPEMAE